MERWIKSLVMLIVLIVWTVYMLANMAVYILGRGPLPEAALWGVPGGIWLALNPPIPSKIKKDVETHNELL